MWQRARIGIASVSANLFTKCELCGFPGRAAAVPDEPEWLPKVRRSPWFALDRQPLLKSRVRWSGFCVSNPLPHPEIEVVGTAQHNEPPIVRKGHGHPVAGE